MPTKIFRSLFKLGDVKNISFAESGPQKRRYIPPSSVGFSFFIKGKKIGVEIECSAVKYNQVKNPREKGQFTGEEWERIELPPEVKRVRSNKVRKIYPERIPVFEGYAEIYCLWRPYEDGWITTISLANTNEMLPDSREWNFERSIKCLFETNLKCKIVDGSVGSYPKIDKSLLTDEEQEIELQYKHRHIYAIGHGAAVDWKIGDNGWVTEIQTEFLPVIEVPQVTVDVKGNDNEALKLAFLEKCGKGVGQVCEQLDLFVASYENWVNKQQNQIHEIALDDYERGAGNRILKRMRNVVLRMRRGVALLRSNSLITRAFGMANAAMLSQMARRRKQGPQQTVGPLSVAALPIGISADGSRIDHKRGQ